MPWKPRICHVLGMPCIVGQLCADVGYYEPDFRAEGYAVIDCRKKVIVFRPPREQKYEVVGSCVRSTPQNLSALQVAFFGHVVTSDGISVDPSKIEAVVSWSRQKSYADNRHRNLEFDVGDHVFLKIAPMKGVMRFGRKGKLSPKFIGPFEILDKVGPVAYRLALPPVLSRIHNVFHVAMLRKYVPDPSHVINYDELELSDSLGYEEVPVQILDRKVQELRNRTIPQVKVLWRNHAVEEASWESEEQMKQRYPHLFQEV
ncbi:uncharacterized protein LOC131163554 [Malania oleifera]|uniref:uncharacterized protein LOC131163554 n=1 Tax=Malania oleifera TaxID=397392 RepID=UPI0025AE1EF4|nr:uncharacterized protein LOC131163554 [Malania oleifera]